MENASLLLKMARDLAIPPVAVQPVNTGGGSSGYQHLDAGDAGPPSPDRVERSSSESSDEVDYGGGGEEAEEGEALYRQFLARRMAEERLMDNGISSMDGRRRGRRRRLDFEGQITPRQGEVREDLATLAERFARSEGREAVRRRADQVRLSQNKMLEVSQVTLKPLIKHVWQVELRSITQDNFSQLLSELFHDGGVTQAKILSPYYGIPIILCNSGANPGSLLLLLRPCLAGNQSWSPCHSLQTDKVILSQLIHKVYEKLFSKDSTVPILNLITGGVWHFCAALWQPGFDAREAGKHCLLGVHTKNRFESFDIKCLSCQCLDSNKTL